MILLAQVIFAFILYYFSQKILMSERISFFMYVKQRAGKQFLTDASPQSNGGSGEKGEVGKE